MAVSLLFCLSVGIFAIICFIADRRDAGADKVVVKSGGSPEIAVCILRGAAREMGADIFRIGDDQTDGIQGNIVMVAHGEENGGIWAVQISVRKAWKGTCVELAVLGQGLSEKYPDMYNTSRDRRDALARRLRG